MRSALISISLLCLSIGSAYSQVEPEKKEDQENEIMVKPPERVYPPRIKFSCALQGGEKSYKAVQNEANLGNIFEIKIRRCTHEISSDGVYGIRLKFELIFNREANVSNCSGFTTALLTRTYVEDTSFRWSSNYKVHNRISIKNAAGERKSLEYLAIHSELNAKKKLGEFLFPLAQTPDFSEYFWADIGLIEETFTGRFQQEVRKRAPIVSEVKSGEFDLQVPIKVEVFKPQGWCVAPAADGKNEPEPQMLTFE